MARLLIVSRSMALAMRLADQHDVAEHPVDELDALIEGDLDTDVLVLDIGDPILAVLAVNELREAGRATPVLLVSGYQPEWEQVEAQDVEGVHVVPLPVTRAALLEGIGLLCGEDWVDPADEARANPDEVHPGWVAPDDVSPDDVSPDEYGPEEGPDGTGWDGAPDVAEDATGAEPDPDGGGRPDSEFGPDDRSDRDVQDHDPDGGGIPDADPAPAHRPENAERAGPVGAGRPGSDATHTAEQPQPSVATYQASGWDTPGTDLGPSSPPEGVRPAARGFAIGRPGPAPAQPRNGAQHANSAATAGGAPSMRSGGGRRMQRLGNRPRKLQRNAGAETLRTPPGIGLVTDPLGPRTDPYGLAAALDRRLDAEAARGEFEDPSAELPDGPVSLVRELLAHSGELYGVSDTAQVLADDVIERADADAAAILVPDGPIWRVSGGVGLRPLERRLILEDAHWLITEIGAAGRAVLIEDTDIVRQQLAGAPLAAWRHLLAVPVPDVRAIVVLARGHEAGPFTDQDLAAVIEPVQEAAVLLRQALQIRRLARRLGPLQESQPDSPVRRRPR